MLVPVNTRFKGAEAADILGRSGARALVTVTDFLGTDYVALLDDAGVDLPRLETVVVAHGPVPAGAESWAGVPGPGHDAGAGRGGPAPRRRRAPTIPSDILFTSGTTGRARRASSRPTVARCGWPPTGWP